MLLALNCKYEKKKKIQNPLRMVSIDFISFHTTMVNFARHIEASFVDPIQWDSQ